jgi:glucokinase-like ROK family protein
MNNMTILGSNVSQVKMHNMRAVLLSLLNNEPAYRVQIAKQTSLSTTTITNIIDELLRLGIVAEDGIEESSGQRRVGRPRAALRLVKDARYAVGVQIGVGTYKIALANLKAEIQFSRNYTFSNSTPPKEIFGRIASQIEEIIAESGIERQRIMGIGVGAAGLVNYHTGVNILSTNLGWENIPIRDCLVERLDRPVVVDNNVKAMALAEAYFGSGKNASSLVFIYSRAGVGSGIVIGNRLLRGADLGAGEIGHMILIADGGKRCHCGQCGCLETLVSEPALLLQAQELSQEHPDGLLAQYLATAEDQRLDQVFKAARKGDPDAKAIIERSARYLGIALANTVNLLNPEVIVLGGLFHQGRDLILPVASETLQNTVFGGLGKKVKLWATSFGWQAGIVGAAVLALTALFYLSPEQI